MEIEKDNSENSMAGKRVGVYELKREIGRGGMGAVYLAERADGEFRQTVAVKLIKRGMDTDAVLKRFRRERQITAALDHPNIAYFLAGGSTEDGLPYFVMEYIEGKPLYRFFKENESDITERLKVFRQICEAVEAAHRKQIIHRDLKPSNVLVKADGTPKLLDFGIAKVLDPDLEFTDVDPTATAMRVMTPEYASPEQIRGEQVTAASDIYSLGVILYELLTGSRPYRLKRRISFEAARTICEEMPLRPLLQNADSDLQIAELRYISEAGGLKNQVTQTAKADELERIVLKSLRKNASARYKSAAAFAEDIANFLEDRPVNAEEFLSGEFARKRSDKKSVAILPFKIIGAETAENAEDVFLGIGLADAMVSRLSGVQRLVVRPTSSVLSFGKTDFDSFAAGRELNVDFVIDGNIRRVGNRIRVAAQLLNVGENSTHWAERFDEDYTDVLALEDSISERVTASLLPKLTGEERRSLAKRGTDNLRAFEAYIRGRFFWNQFTPEAFPKAIESFQTAVELDPEYALAFVGIADFYSWATIYGLYPPPFSFPKVFAAASRALEIDDQLGEAYAALGLYHSNHWNWAKAEENYRRAVELTPNYSHGHEWLASVLVGTGRFEEGAREMRLAEQLDPMSLRMKALTAWTTYQAGKYEESIAKAREIIALDAQFPQGYVQLANALLEIGEIGEAVEAAQKSVEMLNESPLPVYILCFALSAAGRRGEAVKIAREMDEKSSQMYVPPYFPAMAHLAAGNTDKAFEYFKAAFAERTPWCIWFATEPKLASIRRDKRYADLLKQLKNPFAAKVLNK
jgi:eukaryotic-like serine/threonine-protein kinase